MGKKITQLATITEVADDDLIVGVDVSDTSGSDNGTNKKFTKATLLDGLAPLNPQLTGWNPDAETWVYHNVDDPTGYFKIEDKDVSANYSVGWRIMFTNGGNVIKGIITAITYSDPDTIITFLHEIDPTDNQALYLLQNSAITENYVSPHKAPLGFPLDKRKWMVKIADTTTRAQTNPSDGVWYNLGSIQIGIPIGIWDVDYQVNIRVRDNSAETREGKVTLSTANNSEVDKEMSAFVYAYANGVTDHILYGHITRMKVVGLTSKTTYYLNASVTTGTATELAFQNGTSTCVIRAVCAYL